MKNSWGIALLISLIFHIIVLAGLPQLNLFKSQKPLPKTKKTREIEITPQRIERIRKKEISQFEGPIPPPYVDDLMNKLLISDSQLPLRKPEILEKNPQGIKISAIPQANKELSKNPSYMRYYRDIREKIKNRAYQNYKNIKKEAGEVIVSFVVLRNGRLQNIFLHPDSVNSEILRNITLKSIEESAPFPIPPELLKHSQLEFTIPIQFEKN